MKKTRKMWIIVADGAYARFLAPDKKLSRFLPVGPVEMSSAAARVHSSDLKSDRPGRSFSSNGNGLRHAIEPKHDYHKLEKHKLAVAVADVLDRAQSQHAFDDLVVVAPRRSLGEIRTLLPRRVRACIREEVAKDLVNSTPHELLIRLKPVVERLALRTRRVVRH
jgi:protein required for attachment to host cells